MSRIFSVALPLLALLAVVGFGSSWVIDKATQEWFEKDLRLRAELAVNGAHEALVTSWQQNARLSKVLQDMTRDVRVMSAAACNADLDKTVARTAQFPEVYSCANLRTMFDTSDDDTSDYFRTVSLHGNRVHLGVLPVSEDGKRIGFVTIIQDFGFATHRGALVRSFLFVMLGTVVIIASALVIWFARALWQRWTLELLGFLRGGQPRREFRPFLSDVRELVRRLTVEAESADDGHSSGGLWNAQKLKRILTTQLHQERVLVVANREPYIHERKADGSVVVTQPASGLVTALEPVLRACSGAWIAHGSGSADKENSDKNGRLQVPPDNPSYTLRRVWLNREIEHGYYYGFANEGLWPLCHHAHVRPLFRGEDFQAYQDVNEIFARAVADEADDDDPIVLVQDYHFALLPKSLRQKLPQATIATFWHIPWPGAEQFGICPWAEELLEGLLGSSILSFHTQAHCNNFIECVDRLLEARIDREQQAIIHKGQTTLIRAYPISIEWPPSWLADMPSIADCRREICAKHHLPADAKIGIGVDRLDYTKGIEERLLAVERLLEQHPSLVGRFTFIQIGAPSRTAIPEYRRLSDAVESTTERINERFGTATYSPIILIREHCDAATVYRYYRAADLCYVSSLHDGMNLVAKEFVAAREDKKGVLVLSRFAGAAKELTTALIVNPYDLDAAADALLAALTMTEAEQIERMMAMRTLLAELNVYRWAGKMLIDAQKTRQKARLHGRLSLSLAQYRKSGT